MIRNTDGLELVIHHYAASDVKPFGIHCESCKIDLNRLECVQVTEKGQENGLWFCDDHQPFEFIRKH
jgi:hypothetical protein